jgi:ankyrin repeat protein
VSEAAETLTSSTTAERSLATANDPSYIGVTQSFNMSESRSPGVDMKIVELISCNNANGDTLLHWAVRKHATSTAWKLLQRRMPANLTNDEGQTPLHIAVSLNDLIMSKLLVAAGANLHAEDKHGNSPVDLAMASLSESQSMDDSILEFLVRWGAESTERDPWFRAFCLAILSCKSILVDVFLRRGWSLLAKSPRTGGTTLHVIISSATSLAPLERLIEAGVDVNAADDGGVTALHIAAQICNVEFVEYLIKHGAVVDAIDSGIGGTPFGGAICGAKVDNARALIRAGANVFHKSKVGRPLLHIAAQQGQRAILELMLAAGVAVNTLDELGQTAAYWACENDHLECIEFLIAQGLDPKDGETGLMEKAIKEGHIRIVESLWKHGVPITQSSLSSLHGAEDVDPSRTEMLHFLLRCLPPRQASQEDAEEVDSNIMLSLENYLSFGFINLAAASLEAGCRIGRLDNESCARLLFVSAQHGFSSAARNLLSAASSLETVQKFYVIPHGWRALEIAACQDNTELVKLFLEHGWDPNREDVRGRTSLHLAASCGASDALKELLGDCSVHHRDKDRNTPVHLGASSGSVPVLKLLFDAGGDLNSRNKAGQTPLGIACEQGHAEAVRWLLENGSQCQMGDASHQSPLHHSARHNHVDCIDLLIASGSNVDATCAGGNTPLHLAALTGAWEAISRLLLSGADPNCSNHEGMTPLAVALSRASPSPDTITELLNKTSVDWDASLLRNIIFTSCIGGNKHAIIDVFDRLRRERPLKAKKTVRRVLPELLAELCSSGPAASSVAFPFLLEYMHSSSKEVLSTTILVEAIRTGDDAELAQALVDIDPKNAYLRVPGLWTMLHFACRYGRIKIARALLANGAPAGAKNEAGLPPLGAAKGHLSGGKLKEFENLFSGYVTALDVLMKDNELQDIILDVDLGLIHVDDEDDDEIQNLIEAVDMVTLSDDDDEDGENDEYEDYGEYNFNDYNKDDDEGEEDDEDDEDGHSDNDSGDDGGGNEKEKEEEEEEEEE